MVSIGNDWDHLLKDEFQKEYYQKLRRFLIYEYRHHTVYPDMYDIFNALKYTPYEKTGTWPLFLCTERHCPTALSYQYFQGTA